MYLRNTTILLYVVVLERQVLETLMTLTKRLLHLKMQKNGVKLHNIHHVRIT